MRVLLVVVSVVIVVALYMLALATGYASALADYFWWVFGLCSVLLACLLVVVGRYAWQFLGKRKRRFGAQISRRLALMFTLVAVLPGLFLFGVSAQFISHSIDSWFGNDTADALERSLNLSKSALDLSVDNSVRTATATQLELIAARSLEAPTAPLLQVHSRQEGFSQLLVVDLDGRSATGSNPAQLPPPRLDEDDRAELLQTGSVRGLESVDNRLYAQGWLLLPENDGRREALFFRQPVPEQVAADAVLIEAARAKYAELSYAKQGLQTFFLMTLLMATLLAIALALWAALYFARRFTRPIVLLAEGARAVAQGDLTRQQRVMRADELGELQNIFNHMTVQLRMAREEQESARHYLEHILNSLTTGVITLDNQGCLKAHNRTAEAILGQSLDRWQGKHWRDMVHDTVEAALLAEVLEAIMATEFQTKPVQIGYNLKDEALILLGKATPLPPDSGDGTVLVFDDVTALVRAQKEAAWGEVAQRLAHEIRNPLTPIQLSAERLAWKLSDKLNEADAAVLQRATDTIVKQVAAMKDMVAAFRNYARAPMLNLAPLDLNELVREILVLYEGSGCTLSVNLSAEALMLNADSGALRQVIHNILKNAVEAAESDAAPHIDMNSCTDGENGILTVCNNGKSFSKDMLRHAFDPYVTDKPTGTGLGLPVVKKIIEEHGGRIQLSNRDDGGACVRMTLPLLVNKDAKQ
ncbi:PAS domain S-box-containing protein [Neisseria sp. HSC-16F19]|nr:PAS domain-containing sensor histidine kinase [Neisseria sp. HSC-16F19]MCP2041466.1 PAS domain S-box-containing protein [Neisseria sp. HSC-16F19]